MELDEGKIADAVLALLYLGLHDWTRAWKVFDWEALDRPAREGLIGNPRGKAKPLVFTKERLRRSKELFEAMFGKAPASQ
jgi:hypothetical protein